MVVQDWACSQLTMGLSNSGSRLHDPMLGWPSVTINLNANDDCCWPVADLSDERGDGRFQGVSGPDPRGSAKSPFDPLQT